MALLLYRTEAVQRFYTAITTDAWLAQRVRSVVKDDKTGRFKLVHWKAPADFRILRVSTGDNDGGVVFGAQTFADELGPSVPRDVNRQSDLYVDILYDPNINDRSDDDEMDELEAHVIAAIAAAGRTDEMIGMSYRRRRNLDVEFNGNKMKMTRITFSANYIIDGDDTLPDEA